MRPTYVLACFFVRLLSRLIVRVKIRGSNNIPESGPFIIASNHISYYDPPLVGSFARREVNFMAKKELFKNRLFGALISHLNAHPINRTGFDKAAIDLALKILETGKGLVIFPEGTRARKWDFLPPKPGIGLIAATSGAPVVPAYIQGLNKLWGCFLGREKAIIIYGKPIGSEEIAAFGKDKEGYRKLADEIMGRIRALKEGYLKSGISG
jgi:1-acyl-sn-glycerol-3-phosphate acyltransferase